MSCSTHTPFVFTKSISVTSEFKKSISTGEFVFTKEIEKEGVFCFDSTTIKFGIGTWVIGSTFKVS